MTKEHKSIISATEARIHFGEVMKRAENNETLIVERSAQPKVVIMSVEEYHRLRESGPLQDSLEERLRSVRERYLREAVDVHYDVEGEIRRMREERSDELDNDLR
jgi:prevent-host-death family protein